MHQEAVKVQRELAKDGRVVYLTILVYAFVMSWNNPLRTRYATMSIVCVLAGGSGTEAGGGDVSIISRLMYVLAVPDLPKSQHESRSFA